MPNGTKKEIYSTGKAIYGKGYQQTVSIYWATRCEGCPLRRQCHKSKRNRQIEVNHTLDDNKAEVRELLTSEQRLKHRSNRPIEPEVVFGQIKECSKFMRLRLKGMTGAKIDFGLKAIADNLRKLALAWAKSSFLSKFLFSRQKRRRYMNLNLSNYTTELFCETKTA